ncbi:hypothetical protein [Arthrobacter sp. ZGTC412]|uniref:hypothetical protein n=1 Tax=Arthrobacter sp. ZGTC412 TaxID=2058900 RepID=UPI0021571B2F|nr:hypothetical protein [Arthrobacter sp. ZGTC412]
MSLTTNPRTTDTPKRTVNQVRPKQSLRDRYGDRAFSIAATAVLLLSILAVVYPLYFIVIASISDPNAVYEGKVWLLPSGITTEGYERILADSRIWNGLGNTLVYTVLGTAVSVSTILCGAYALSRKDMPGRKILMLLFVITMFFDGGSSPSTSWSATWACSTPSGQLSCPAPWACGT